MKAGRKPKHDFKGLKIGQKVALKGKSRKFPHQLIYYYNKNNSEKLEIINDGINVYAKRIK